MPCLRHGKAWQGMARHGKAWQGMARHGKAWQGMARHGKAWQGMARHGKAWQGMARHGKAWQGMARHGKAWQGMARHGKAWQGMARHGKAWQGMARAWQGMARHGKAWQGMARHGKAWQGMARHGRCQRRAGASTLVEGKIAGVVSKLTGRRVDFLPRLDYTCVRIFKKGDWGYSSVGRALPLQGRCQRFEPAYLHKYDGCLKGVAIKGLDFLLHFRVKCCTKVKRCKDDGGYLGTQRR